MAVASNCGRHSFACIDKGLLTPRGPVLPQAVFFGSQGRTSVV